MALLDVKGIRKSFGGVNALVNANLTCHAGRITGLLGANGSGKSTVSKIITGVYFADCGSITYNGKKVMYKNPFHAKKDGIAMVFQNLSLIPELTVWQNIALGFEKKKGILLDNKAAKEAARTIVEKLCPGMDIEKHVSKMGPGEMQVVEIAKAIYEKPKVLILDEPTAALEHEQVKNLFKYMKELAADGVGIIFTSHRIWEIIEICDDIVVFRNGENVGYKNFDRDKKDANEIISLITGAILSETNRKEVKKVSDDVLLDIQDLNYQSKLKNVNLQLRKGEILGIGGLAGQGQLELMLAIAGNYRHASGQFMINKTSIKLKKPRDAVRKGILLVPGDRQMEGLFVHHSVYKNLIFPKMGSTGEPLFIPKKKYREESGKIVDTLSIKTHSIDMPVNKLSGGNQQKVVVGKWLSFDTKVLLLADPAKGVDVGAKRDLYEFIKKLVDEKHMSVILYASDNEELIENCDRINIMYEGQIVAQLDGDDINDEKIIEASMRVVK